MSDQLFKRSENALHANVGDDVVALHLDKGLCFGMVDVGAEIWNLLETPATSNQICDQLMQKYEVPLERCRTDVAQFLQELSEAGLIEAVGLPAGGAI